MKKIKRMLSLFLALALLLGILPLHTLADEPDAAVHTEIGAETTLPPEEAGAEITEPAEPDIQPTAPAEETEIPAPTGEMGEDPGEQAEEPAVAAVPGEKEAEIDGQETAPMESVEESKEPVAEAASGEASVGENEAVSPQANGDQSVGTLWYGGYVMGSQTWSCSYKLKDGNHTASVSRIALHRVNQDNSTANARTAYCIEPDMGTTGNTQYNGAEHVGMNENSWNANLTLDQQRAVGLIMLYGEQGRGSAAMNTTKSYKWEVATQILIWEIIVGYRSSTSPYSRNNATLYNLYTGYLRNTSNTDAGYFIMTDAYETISDQLANHYKIPSFTGVWTSVAPTHTMKVSGSNYTLDLTDTNGVLANFSFPTQGGVTSSASGNKLTLTAPTSTNLANVTMSGKSTALKPNPERQPFVVWNRSAAQKVITMKGNVVTDPVPAYFKLAAPNGTIKVTKTTNTGANVSGWAFGIYSNSACTTLVEKVTSNSAGTATSKALNAGTYYVKELPPSGADEYWNCDSSVKTVTVTAGQTASVSFNNRHYGKIKVIKTTNTGKNVSGWTFAIYRDAACTNLVGTKTTGADGSFTTDKLSAGDYWIKELPPEGADAEYWVVESAAKKVTIVAGQTASVTFNNRHYGKIKVIKTTNTGKNVSGWTFNIYRDAACTNLVGTKTTGADGSFTTGLLAEGDFWVKELPPEGADEYWVVESAAKKVTIVAGQTVSVTFNNRHYGRIKVIKTTNTGTNVSGWSFSIYRDAACTNLIGTKTTGADGSFTTDKLAAGDYWVKELPPEGADAEYWEIESAAKKVTLVAGQTASVSFYNAYFGRLEVIKTTNTGTDLEGWRFGIYRNASCTRLVETITTDAAGKAVSGKLDPNLVYYVKELPDSTRQGWQYDTTVANVTVTAGSTALVDHVFQNLQYSTVRIIKTTSTGRDLSGWEFDIYQGTVAFGTPYRTVTTGLDGTIAVDLEPGTYTIRERNQDYWHCDSQNPQTVTIEAGESAALSYHNTQYGRAQIVKTTSTGEKLGGWVFDIYAGAVASGTPYRTVTTADDGTIITDLAPGTYTVVERESAYSQCDDPVRVVTVYPGYTETLSFHNTLMARIRIIKTTGSGENLSGWKFDVYAGWGSDQNGAKPLMTLTSGADGTVSADLEPGMYTIKERNKAGWYCVTGNPKWITVSAMQTVEVPFHNDVGPTVRIVKRISKNNINNRGDPDKVFASLVGWTFDIYSGRDWYDGMTPTYSYTTTEDDIQVDYKRNELVAILEIGLEPGTWTIRERNRPGWVCSPEQQTVWLTAGDVETVEFDNEDKTAVRIIKTIPALNNSSISQAEIEKQYSGWVFDMYEGYWESANDPGFSELTPVATFTTDDGLLQYDLSGNITGCMIEIAEMPGLIYSIVERPRAGWVCQRNFAQVVIGYNGKTQEVTFVNERVGSLTVRKVSGHGAALGGTTWLLEYSTDNGSTWQKITNRTGSAPTAGTCLEAVHNGCITTGSDGTAAFSGLKISGVQYRLTEVETNRGLTLLTKPAFVGSIPYTVNGVPEHDLTIIAINNPLNELPNAGARLTGSLLGACGAALVCLAALIWYVLRKRFA